LLFIACTDVVFSFASRFFVKEKKKKKSKRFSTSLRHSPPCRVVAFTGCHFSTARVTAVRAYGGGGSSHHQPAAADHHDDHHGHEAPWWTQRPYLKVRRASNTAKSRRKTDRFC
jgi:hypothetical protein